MRRRHSALEVLLDQGDQDVEVGDGVVRDKGRQDASEEADAGAEFEDACGGEKRGVEKWLGGR